MDRVEVRMQTVLYDNIESNFATADFAKVLLLCLLSNLPHLYIQSEFLHHIYQFYHISFIVLSFCLNNWKKFFNMLK